MDGIVTVCALPAQHAVWSQFCLRHVTGHKISLKCAESVTRENLWTKQKSSEFAEALIFNGARGET